MKIFWHLLIIIFLMTILFSCKKEKSKLSFKYVNMVEVTNSEFQWTGVAVSKEGRMFVNFPRWSPDIPMSVGEILPSGKIVPYPDSALNSWQPEDNPEHKFVCVQSVYVDKESNLWILDPALNIYQGQVAEGGPKLLKINLNSDRIEQVFGFDSTIAPPKSYLNDVRIDVKKQIAYITDSGVGAIIVVDLNSGEIRRLLSDHPSTKSEDIVLTIEGKDWLRPDGSKPKIHSDGLSLDNSGEYLYYQALTGRSLYRIKTKYLLDKKLTENKLTSKVEYLGEIGAADAIEFGQDDNLYLTSIELNAIRRYTPDKKVEVLIQDEQLKWPDSFTILENGDIYVTTSQIHLGQNRTQPYRIFKLQSEK